MAVKPAAGETVKETKYTEVIPASEPGERIRLPELWDFVETLSPTTDLSNPDYQFTIYRGMKSQKSDEKEWLGKFHERMTREKIQSMFGGGVFNVWLKLRVGKGNALELKYNEDLKIGGEPRAAAAAGGGASSASIANDPLSRLIDLMDRRLAQMEAKLETATGSGAAVDAVRQAMTLNGQVFSAAMPAVTGALQKITEPHNAAPNPMDDLNRQFMTAMIAKMLNPSDPIEQFSKMLMAMKGVPGLMGVGGDKTGIALELVRQVPQVAMSLVQGVEHWRFAEEARARHAAILRGGAPAIPANPIPQAPAAPPNVIPMPAAAHEAASEMAPQQPAIDAMAELQRQPIPPMPIEQIEMKLCEIIADMNLTTEQAATEACALIERFLPGMTEQMASRGEEYILDFFRTQRPILRQVAEHPRLLEFVRKFIETVNAAPVVQLPNPAAPVA